MRDWVISALQYAGLSQADLTRELATNYKWSDNRSILNKIVTGERDLKADEMYDISKATGFPIPEGSIGEQSVPLVGYIGAAPKSCLNSNRCHRKGWIRSRCLPFTGRHDRL